MENERLRMTMSKRGFTAQALAAQVGVDSKTVERWVSTGRVPYVRTAVQAAEVLEEDVMFLWPTLRRGRTGKAVSAEVVAVYEQRARISPAMWRQFFEQASEWIDILVYAANHLHESIPGFVDLLVDKAREGCQVRVTVGDPTSPNVAARGAEERFGLGIQSRCELALMYYQPLADRSGAEVRMHGTTLYNSIYRSDQELLVNSHLWGINAFGAPIWHLRQTQSGSMAKSYLQSFEAVWEQSRPVQW